jgi:hypothetical protein
MQFFCPNRLRQVSDKLKTTTLRAAPTDRLTPTDKAFVFLSVGLNLCVIRKNQKPSGRGACKFEIFSHKSVRTVPFYERLIYPLVIKKNFILSLKS